MDASPPARPDLGQIAAPPPAVRKRSAGTMIAVIAASVLAGLVIVALVIVIAVAFMGRSASSQFEQIGHCVDARNDPACSSLFPSP